MQDFGGVEAQLYVNRGVTVSWDFKLINAQFKLYIEAGLNTVPVVLSSEPLGFWRDMLSEISLQGQKDNII